MPQTNTQNIRVAFAFTFHYGEIDAYPHFHSENYGGSDGVSVDLPVRIIFIVETLYVNIAVFDYSSEK